VATATRFRQAAGRVEHDDNNIKVKHFKIIKALCIAGLFGLSPPSLSSSSSQKITLNPSHCRHRKPKNIRL